MDVVLIINEKRDTLLMNPIKSSALLAFAQNLLLKSSRIFSLCSPMWTDEGRKKINDVGGKKINNVGGRMKKGKKNNDV